MELTTTKTSTYSETYTHPRIDVIGTHFELFLRCAGEDDSTVEKFLKSIKDHELQAIGIYIEEDGYRIAEVELEIDWEEHLYLTNIKGDLFDTDLSGWKNNVAPEAYVLVSRLAKASKDLKLPISSWILVSDHIRQSPEEHKRVCEKLGYLYGSSIPPWKKPPMENSRKILGMEELKVAARSISE